MRAYTGLLLAVFGFLAAPAVCASGIARPYDAGKTFSCLKERPEYRPQGWYPGKPTPPHEYVKTAFTFQPLLPTEPRPLRFDRFNGAKRVRGWEIPLDWLGKDVDLAITDLFFYDTAKAANTSFRFGLARAKNATSSDVALYFREQYQVDRNVLIDWALPTFPRRAHAVVIHCLRAH